ncbi:hypothetical protein, conserved [Eimeria acervulina]|uniref:Uncharacterized protein n=1 Tax=Eimeria acervulina TaxID=5801 RepID=U6GQG1_EIMAC|nr:hypothetical protein, conserved [Eimeria acervulina]CDI81807.1 hypothetical protein, conserved [Eimeria acervulina]
MFVGGPEDIPIEGDEFEKSKPRVLSIAGYCFLSLIAHFFVQDVGGALSMAILGGLLYYYSKKPTHLSITLALGMSLAILFMSGFIWFSILLSTHLQLWLADIVTQLEFILYVLDFGASCLALFQLQYVFDSPTYRGPRSFLPRWAESAARAEGWKGWSPFQGEGQRLGGWQ